MQSAAIKNNTNFKIPAKQFTLWIFLVSVVMLFAGFTSAYIVRKAEGNWMTITMPTQFQASLVVVLLSSVTMGFAQYFAKLQKRVIVQMLTGLTLLGGLAFTALQLMGWEHLTQNGIYLVGNASAGFLYIISGLHLLHLVGGIVVLSVVMVQLFSKNFNNSKLNSAAIYWHFVGLLWLYLYLFLQNV